MNQKTLEPAEALPPDQIEAARVRPDHMRIGIAFGAGAARGWSHIGVVERLLEAGISLDVVAGTSIGALVGGCLAADRLPALKEFALGITRRRLFSFLDISWGGSGLITGDRLAQLLEDNFGTTEFDELRMPFICIATELMTGHEIWLRQGPVAAAIRASYALPGVFRPVHHNHQWLIDGAVVNPIPVSACRAMGARLVIAVNLSSDAFGGTIIQQPATLVPPGNGNGNGSVNGTLKKSPLRQALGRPNNPGLTTVLLAAFNISQDRLSRSRLAGDPPDITIVPKTGPVGLFEFDKAAETIALGREAAERALPEIETALEVLERLAGR